MSKKRSVIWEFFHEDEDSKYAVCNQCEMKVPRGGSSTKSYTTTNLIQHLSTKHVEIHKQYLERKVSSEATAKAPKETRKRTLQQLSLEATEERTKTWDINDPRAQKITRKVGEMVAIDCHPLSVTEDVGFTRVLKALEPRYNCPSRKYFTECIIPRICSEMKEEVSKLLSSDKPVVSLTTDIWSCSSNDTSLLSLTAHWIDKSFTKVSAVLHAQALEMAHTGEYIAERISSMLESWGIPQERVHLVISDNASNMVKAMQEASLAHFGCFAHSLQLVVKDGLLSQRAITDIIAICRSIVGHFHRSSTASHCLTKIQDSLKIPKHKLKQDVSTRWNSTLYMFQSIVEQKMALAAYCAENDSIQQLSTYQLVLIKKCVDILSPIEEVTRSISARLASISIVIPYVRVLIRTLEKNDEDSGVRTMKGQILHSLRSRFAGIEERKELALATMLDPRFKDKFFGGNIIKATVKEWVLEEMASVTTVEVEPQQETTAPKRMCPLKNPVLLDVFTEIISDSSDHDAASSTTSELDKYLNNQLIDYRTGDPYNWWGQHHKNFPILSILARRFLSPPATSVPSEQLFSAAGDLYDEKRNRLLPHLSEELLFIQNNFCLVGQTYEYKA